MKEPNIDNLEIDQDGTQDLRKKLSKSKKVKITINLDEDLVISLKEIADESGSKYQTLMNMMIRQALEQKNSESSRLDRLEKEIELLKKHVAA